MSFRANKQNFSPTLTAMTPTLAPTLALTTLIATLTSPIPSLLRRRLRHPPRSARPRMIPRFPRRRTRLRKPPLRAPPSSLATSAGRSTTTFSTRSSSTARASPVLVLLLKTAVPEVSDTSTLTALRMQTLLSKKSRAASWMVVT